MLKGKFRWIDLALLPFGLCVLFLLLLGKLFGLTYKQISVVFNLWVQGAVLALSGLAPFGVAIYKLVESFSVSWMVLTIILACYGLVYLYAFIKMLQHYHLPFNDAYYLCVRDLRWLARKWHTTYYIVNLLIFVIFYLILLGFNIFICNYLISL
jgi:nitrate/nitrite transporter NarK